jgi:hypothetical protein
MQTEAGLAETTQSDAVDATGRSGKCGTGQPRATTSTRHSRQQWKPAKCDACGEPLQEWEVRICEGCGIFDATEAMEIGEMTTCFRERRETEIMPNDEVVASLCIRDKPSEMFRAWVVVSSGCHLFTVNGVLFARGSKQEKEMAKGFVSGWRAALAMGLD